MNTQVGQNICHSLAVNLPKWPFSTHCYEVAQIYEPGRNSMDLINRKFPQIQGLPLSTPQPTFSVQWPRYASTIILLRPFIKIPINMAQTYRNALLSFFGFKILVQYCFQYFSKEYLKNDCIVLIKHVGAWPIFHYERQWSQKMPFSVLAAGSHSDIGRSSGYG